MTPQYQIRPYRPEDRDRLLVIWRDGTEIAHGFFSQAQMDAQQKLVGDIYLAQAETWVIEAEGRTVGFCGLLGNFVGGLFVDPAHHGRGFGRLLLDHACSLKGPLELDVYALNKNAMAFYRKLGFSEIERRAIDDNGLPFEVVKFSIDPVVTGWNAER
jgi:GNAT superfamily N-acetyltransferase